MGSIVEVKVKVHTLDIAPLRGESSPQNRSGMARRVLKGFRSFTGTPTRSSAIGIKKRSERRKTCALAVVRRRNC